jgi:hypothetical protein
MKIDNVMKLFVKRRSDREEGENRERIGIVLFSSRCTLHRNDSIIYRKTYGPMIWIKTIEHPPIIIHNTLKIIMIYVMQFIMIYVMQFN